MARTQTPSGDEDELTIMTAWGGIPPHAVGGPFSLEPATFCSCGRADHQNLQGAYFFFVAFFGAAFFFAAAIEILTSFPPDDLHYHGLKLAPSP